MTGFINVNKAAGASSAKEVAVIKKLTHMPCGHMGTLDPMADGVLPVAVGNAARLFDSNPYGGEDGRDKGHL